MKKRKLLYDEQESLRNYQLLISGLKHEILTELKKDMFKYLQSNEYSIKVQLKEHLDKEIERKFELIRIESKFKKK